MSIGAVLESLFKKRPEKIAYDPQDDKRPSPSMDWASQGDNSPKP